MSTPPATVLFWDIDGTLLTTDRAGISAWEGAVLARTGVRLNLASTRTAGLTDGQIAASLLGRCAVDPKPEEVARLLRAYEALLPAALAAGRGGVLDGVEEILGTLPGPPVALSLLLTGNTAAGAQAKLGRYGLASSFPAGGAFCEGAGPRSEIAERALDTATRLAGSAPDLERVFVIGDTPHDIACAHAIGARAIAVATGGYDLTTLEQAGPWTALAGLPPAGEFAALVGLANGAAVA